MRSKAPLVLLFILAVLRGFAQQVPYNAHQRGQAYFFWGWNAAAYSNSDITLKGADYDFTIYKVVALDKPTFPVAFDPYLKPGALSIPQTNFKLGYFIKDNLAINIGIDHMKYVMVQNQVVNMVGTISRKGDYKGVYNGPQEMKEDLLTFEHTDGLNYVNAEIEKYGLLYHSRNNRFVLSFLYGGGIGALVPKTNVKLLDYERNDRFHLSGFGLNLKAGINAVFFKHLMIRLEGKGGYINMPDIILHQSGIPGRGKQYFFFGEFDGGIGFTCNLTGKKAKEKEKSI